MANNGTISSKLQLDGEQQYKQALKKLKQDYNLQRLVNYRHISLRAFRHLWSSEEEDFIIRQEQAYDSIHGAGAYVASFIRDSGASI